jgi:CHAT domain-containing protein
MHRIPIHAISLAGKVLIERNPIVYIQSLSLLKLCRNTFTAHPHHGDIEFRGTIFNTLMEDSSGDSQALSTLADSIPGCELISSDRFRGDRKTFFKENCSVSNLVHVHGHAEFEDDSSSSRSASQCLKLKEPSDGSADDMNLNEIFSTLRFRQPSLILAMGCRTGRSRISAVNDLLGLTAAFHFAGAGAVVGALWKIWRADALRFAQKFYEELGRNLDDDRDNPIDSQPYSEAGNGAVDLAKAYQRAVLALRKDENGKVKKPYHWAGFVSTELGCFQN